MKSNNILEVRNLSKSFKKNFWSSRDLVLKDLSFSIPKGSVTGFLGANGSGKTSSFKCLLELIKKDHGEIYFFGEALSLKNRSRIGFLPERPQLYDDLTAEECLFFYSSLTEPLSPSLKNRIEYGLKKLGLYEWRDKRLKTFSKGMLQKIGILQSLVHEPELLILDEPFSGLDPESRFLVIELFEQMIEKGCTLFLSSHIFQDIERICDRLVIIREGELIFEGNFLDLPLVSSQKQNILYLLKDKKQILKVSDKETCQKELKRLLSEGAVILSLNSQSGNLEQQYKALMLSKKKDNKS